MNGNNSIKILEKKDKNFPWFLANMEDAPQTLYCLGDISLLNMPSIAVVGARKCSDYGQKVASRIGEMLANSGYVTISGMALGIDTHAHRGALSAGGKTIAVLGCGPDICYPSGNGELYRNICNHGLVVSEYMPGTRPKPWHFPRRNRIISALSQGVVVVEAGLKSGSLITAETAATQGREVMVIPGNINSSYSLGANKLIQDGATIITQLDDIFRICPPPSYADINQLPLTAIHCGTASTVTRPPHGRVASPAEVTAITSDHCGAALDSAAPLYAPLATDLQHNSSYPPQKLGVDEEAVYRQIAFYGTVTCDRLCTALNKKPAFINGIITTLEIKGMIYCTDGKISVAKF